MVWPVIFMASASSMPPARRLVAAVLRVLWNTNPPAFLPTGNPAFPATINVDNGTEFTSRAFDHWAYTNQVRLDFSRPGKPTDDATIESFNASVRRECLSQHYFSTLAEAQVVLRAYQGDFNNHRPHSSLGQQTPAQFRAGCGDNADRVEASKRVA
jgi:transposase InsO family protein